jgi:hypothetical protein
MTQDEIYKITKQADKEFYGDREASEWVEYFAKLVATHEREACAKVCEELVIEVVGNSALAVDQCARTIRAIG